MYAISSLRIFDWARWPKERREEINTHYANYYFSVCCDFHDSWNSESNNHTSYKTSNKNTLGLWNIRQGGAGGDDLVRSFMQAVAGRCSCVANQARNAKRNSICLNICIFPGFFCLIVSVRVIVARNDSHYHATCQLWMAEVNQSASEQNEPFYSMPITFIDLPDFSTSESTQ